MEDKVLLKQVKENPMIIENLENPSYEILEVAVKKSGIAIKFIDNPSFELKKEAIKSNPLSIEYMENLEELQIMAVRLLGIH